MTLPMVDILRTIARSVRVTLALAFCLAVLPARLDAQCTLQSAPKSFEPSPPGAGRLGSLSSGFNNHLAVFQNGASGPRRLIMQESYGYSILDLSNPLNPTALYYHDLRFPVGGPNTVAAHGDGQSYVQTIAVSPDGARGAFSLSGPGVPPWNTVVGSTDGTAGFTIWGDFFPNKASGTVIQQLGARYIAYETHPFLNAVAIDVTTLPAFLDQNGSSMQSETTSWPAGGALSLAGNFLVYMAGSDIQVIDAANPGPPGAVTAGMPKTAVTSADFGGRTPLNFTAAVDPADPNKLWVLVELAAAAGQVAPGYGLVSLTRGFAGAAQSAGPLFQVPSNPGDFFPNVGSASALIASNGSLFVLMWAKEVDSLNATHFLLYSTTASAWASVPPTSFQVSGAGFGLTSMMTGFSDPGTSTIYAYVPTTVSAYVIPMNCQAPNTSATASVGNLVANGTRQLTSCPSGAPSASCTVFYGDKITGTIGVIPASSAQQPITGFNFDFDFHAGNPLEDAGAGIFPRIKSNDNAALGVALGAPLPTSFTMVGPCDPNLTIPGVTVTTGVGCWNSVRNNAAVGGPDFTGAETSATPCKQLTLAVEAQNQFGSTGAGLASLCWQAPAARVQSTQILTGGSLTSASDGQPTGYQWAFGPVGGPLTASCITIACAPPAPFNTKGTYAYSLSTTYFPDQQYTATTTGTYTVTDFVPKFLVNNSATDRITVAVTQSTISVTNQSVKGAGVVGAYSYAFCPDPCANWAVIAPTAWPAMTDGGSATLPNQAKGSWILRIHVGYTGTATGAEDWAPNNAGAADSHDFRFTVTDVIPTISFKINGLNPCSGFGVCANPVVGDTLTAFSNPSDPAATWDFTGASPATGTGQGAPFSYGVQGNYTVTLTQSGVQVQAPVTVNARPAPPAAALAVSAFASPNPAPVNTTVTFTCNASGGAGGYTFTWASNQFPAGAGQTISQVFPQQGSYSAICTATDTAGASNTATAFVTVGAAAPPPAACTASSFLVKDTATGNEAQQTGGLGVFFYKAAVGQSLTFVPTGTFSTTVWDFGDGSTSTATQPTHTYTTTGQFAPSVTFDGNSASCKKARTVNVAGVSGAFSAAYADSSPLDTTQITSGKALSFHASDPDDGSTTFAWDFGDGGSASGAAVSHTFFAFGSDTTFTIRLTVAKGAQTASSAQAFTVVAPPESPKWFVGGMAYLAGSIPGTVWQSELTILNPHPTLAATYSLAFLDGGKAVDPASLVYKTISLGPQSSATSSNVLGDFFGLPLGSFGAIIVRGDAAPVPPSITSRTFNNGDPTKGSFGLSVPTSEALDGAPPPDSTQPQSLIGLRDNDAAYTNIGLVNLVSSDWSHAHVNFFDAAGATLGVLNVDVPPYGVAQLNKPLTKQKGADGLGQPPSALFRAQVTVDSGGAVFPYATVIDAKSTDPIIVTPTAAPANTYLVPGIVRQSGKNGERFRSRVTVVNASTSGRTVRVTLGYQLCDSAACAAPSTVVGDVRMNPGQSQSWDDFVKVWFKVFNNSDVADSKDYKNSWVDVRPAPGDAVTDPLLVLGETYNETPNGDASAGRVGFQIPGYTPTDGAGSAVAEKQLLLAGLASSAAYRTNIALFAVAGVTTNWCTVHVFGQDGTKLRDIPVQVSAFASVDNATLFGGLPGGPYSLVIDSIDAGVTVGGYATVIDNTSGDATFVKAVPAP